MFAYSVLNSFDSYLKAHSCGAPHTTVPLLPGETMVAMGGTGFQLMTEDQGTRSDVLMVMGLLMFLLHEYYIYI